LFNNGYLLGNVFELANIARPGVIGKQLAGVFVKGDGGHTVLFGEVHGKFSKEQVNILLSFTKRGNVYGNGVETVEEILPELTLLNGFIEVDVGGGHHPYVCFYHLRGANPYELTSFKNP